MYFIIIRYYYCILEVDYHLRRPAASTVTVVRCCQAATLEGVTTRVVIVENAVSDVRTAATVRRAGDNQGDTRIRHGAEPCMGSCPPVVRTVLLDDLLEACRFDRAIMKVDVQGYEHRAFAHAGALFDNIRMTYVFMEWVLMARHYVAANHTSVDKTLVENMLKFLFERNYRPYTLSSEGERPLDPDVWGAWPDDIVWHLMPNTAEYRIQQLMLCQIYLIACILFP